MIELTANPPTLFGNPRKIRALCSDGIARSARLSPLGADTFFSIPASVSVKGRTVSGYVTRETLAGYSTETIEDPAVWKFLAYQYGKNHALLPRGAFKKG